MFRAVPTAEGIRVEWQLSDPSAFQSVALERAPSAEGGWSPVSATPTIESGMSVVLDAAAPADMTVHPESPRRNLLEEFPLA